jgi:hypothetical protein
MAILEEEGEGGPAGLQDAEPSADVDPLEQDLLLDTEDAPSTSPGEDEQEEDEEDDDVPGSPPKRWTARRDSQQQQRRGGPRRPYGQ